jgi:hypothetical protein
LFFSRSLLFFFEIVATQSGIERPSCTLLS